MIIPPDDRARSQLAIAPRLRSGKLALQPIRVKIYERYEVLFYSADHRPRKLRQLCPEARGVDLRTRAGVESLAIALGILSAEEGTQPRLGAGTEKS